ncbi:replicative DNA helicase [Acinetobacter puyangensis]|uniref:replicative DNA helicase n=1 Tax=Acinetobacter puyangensis TaxID=1096779 RepID=UPI003A4D637D
MSEYELHSTSLEMSVLAALMTIANCYEQLDTKPTVDDFYAVRHRYIFTAIEQLALRGEEYDMTLVKNHLQQQGLFDDCGGDDHLNTIMYESSTSLFNVNSYVIKLKKFTERRQVDEVGKKMIILAKSPDADDLTLRAQDLINTLENPDRNKTLIHIADASIEALDIIEQRLSRQRNNTGLAYGVNTGLSTVDYIVGDIEPTHFCVIAARPSMGKTTLAQMIALNAARRNHAPTLFVSCEMTGDQIAARMFSALGGIKFSDIKRGTMSEQDYAMWIDTTTRILNDLPLKIEQKAAATIPEIRESARKVKSEYGSIGLIIIDYLQLLRDPTQRNRYDEISQISRQLKKLAKDFHCPVVALSQLSRDCEKRKPPRPILSDLRESGQIEQDADQVLLLYRDEVYNQNSQEVGVAEIIVAKNRHGATGTARVACVLEMCHFADIQGEVE